jgi:hypothetical protein
LNISAITGALLDLAIEAKKVYRLCLKKKFLGGKNFLHRQDLNRAAVRRRAKGSDAAP